MTFEEFWDDAGWHKDFKDDLEEVWNAAQQAERERIKNIIKDHALGGWIRCCNQILEGIGE